MVLSGFPTPQTTKATKDLEEALEALDLGKSKGVDLGGSERQSAIVDILRLCLTVSPRKY